MEIKKKKFNLFDCSKHLTQRILAEMMESGCKPGCKTFAALIAILGLLSDAVDLYEAMKKIGVKPNEVVYGSLINGFAESGMAMLDEAIEVAEEMRESGLLTDCTSFNQAMACYAANGQLRECCELFHEMLVERKLLLDWGTFKTLFTLLKKGGVPSEPVAQLQTAYNEAKPLATPVITATLFSAMGMYAYAMDSCQELTRDEIPLEHFAYNDVIYTYGASGDIDMVLKAYMRMQEKGLKPDIVTHAYLVGVYGKVGMVEGVKRVHSWITFGELEPNQSLFRAVRDAYVSANRQDLVDVVKKEMSIAFEDQKVYSLRSGEEEEEESESEEDEAF